MNSFQAYPLKLYIQDVFRATRSEENQYVYEFLGYKFKNIMIHGVVTSIYDTTDKSTFFELSDPTGCVQIYYDINKDNTKLSEGTVKDLVKSFACASRSGHNNIITMSSLLNSVENNYKKPLDFECGSHVSVVGDIFRDDIKNVRMICAYTCITTSVVRDIVWLEELRHLYDRFYLRDEHHS